MGLIIDSKRTNEPTADARSPRRIGQTTQTLYVQVEDLSAHVERARTAGARIIQEPMDQPYGDRTYGAEDPEGHCWYFAERLREMRPPGHASRAAE